MNFSNITPFNTIAAASLTLLLSACGSNDTASTGTLTLSVTDAPVDMADKVIVEFSGVELKPAKGDNITFDFSERCSLDPTLCQIDLLALTNGLSEKLLDGKTLPAGKYNWMRLMVNAEPNVKDSYIVVAGSEYELRIPSGAESGLKLNRGFDVPAGGVADFTIDFDLRKSVHNPGGKNEYVLRPTLRIVDNAETGTLSGNIDPSFYAGGMCTGAVYVFNAGTEGAPDDEDGEGFGPDPITTALVTYDGNYKYKLGFLSEGDDLIAFTCDAETDEPDEDDDTATVNFLSSATVNITAKNNTVYNF